MTLMFQAVKVYIGSLVRHKYIAGEDVVGDWGASIPCSYCLKLVYEGEFTLEVPPSYRGLPLGLEREMVFKSHLQKPGRGDPVTAYHTYLGDELARTVTNWERLERVLETDTIDGGTLTHNSSINISELARANLETLLIYAFSYIRLSSLPLD